MKDQQYENETRILAVADIHGKAHRFTILEEAVNEYQPDVVVVAGDIISYRRTESSLQRLSKLNQPVLIVSGNSDFSKVKKRIPEFHALNYLRPSPSEAFGIPFIGLNGTIPIPFFSLVRLREKTFLESLKNEIRPESVLITHTPPRGFQDRVAKRFHAGSKGLARLIRETQPRLLVCGHIHEDDGYSHLGKTCIVNCSIGGKGKGALMKLKQSGKLDVKML